MSKFKLHDQHEQIALHDTVDAAFGRSLSTAHGAHPATPGQTPSLDDELRFITGVDANGKTTSDSYWGAAGTTAHKWGATTLGKGAVITYSFDAASHFTAAEKATFLKALAAWSALGDVTFQEDKSGKGGILLERGHDGGFYTSVDVDPGKSGAIGGTTHATISVDTSVYEYQLSGNLNQAGGFGFGTLIQQVGYALGLGMGGAYGNDAPANQYSAFDNQMYSTMSNISWADWNARYVGENPIQETFWGDSFDPDTGGSYLRTRAHTPMLLDIEAIQKLYGVSTHSPFGGGQTYGFNCNVAGPLHDFYDFNVNYSPVVTLYNQGANNTLDLSGWYMHESVTLKQGGFSSIGGLFNNVFIQFGTKIDTAIGGHGNDTIYANDDGDKIWGMDAGDEIHGGAGADWINGGKGWDTVEGGAGADLFVFDDGDASKNKKLADRVLDFSHAQGDRVDLSAIDAIKGGGDDAFKFLGNSAFTHHAGELHFEVIKGDAFLSGDVDGDGKADFYVQLQHVAAVVQADLVL